MFNSLLLISSFYLLRFNLIYSTPLILPLTFHQLALNVLTSRLNLIVYITEDILNLKIWSSVQSILDAISDSYKKIKTYFYSNNVFWDLVYAAIPLSTVDAQEPDLDILGQEESIKREAASTFNLNNEKTYQLYNIDLNIQELIHLKHLTYVKENLDLFLFVSPRGQGQELIPVKLRSVIFDLSKINPNVVVLPGIKLFDSSVQIPLFKLITENDNIGIENSQWKFVVVINQSTSLPSISGEIPHLSSSRDIFVLEKYYESPYQNDWKKNNRIHVRYQLNNYNLYEAYRLDMRHRHNIGKFVIKQGLYRKNPIVLDLTMKGKPCLVTDISYSHRHSFYHDHYLRVKQWHRLYLLAQYNNCEISRTDYEQKLIALNAWNGINDPIFNEKLSQSRFIGVIPSGTTTAQANAIIASWRF